MFEGLPRYIVAAHLGIHCTSVASWDQSHEENSVNLLILNTEVMMANI